MRRRWKRPLPRLPPLIPKLCFLGLSAQLHRREANCPGLAVDAEEQRLLHSINVEPHHYAVAYAMRDEDGVALDGAVVFVRRTPVLQERRHVVRLILLRMLLPVRIVVPLAVRLIHVAALHAR